MRLGRFVTKWRSFKRVGMRLANLRGAWADLRAVEVKVPIIALQFSNLTVRWGSTRAEADASRVQFQFEDEIFEVLDLEPTRDGRRHISRLV